MEELMHFLIPVAILLIAGFKKKHVLILSFLSVLPDLDVIIPPRRAFFHNVFALLIVIVVSYLIAKKKKLSKKFVFIAIFMYASHLLLDVDSMAVMYPVSNLYVGYKANVTINKLTLEIKPYFELMTREGYDTKKDQNSYLLSPSAFYISGLIAVFLVLFKIYCSKVKN